MLSGCLISPSFQTLDINDDLVVNVTESIRDWRYDLISDFMQDLLAEQVNSRIYEHEPWMFRRQFKADSIRWNRQFLRIHSSLLWCLSQLNRKLTSRNWRWGIDTVITTVEENSSEAIPSLLLELWTESFSVCRKRFKLRSNSEVSSDWTYSSFQSIRFTRLLSDILCYSVVNDREKSLIESLLGWPLTTKKKFANESAVGM